MFRMRAASWLLLAAACLALASARLPSELVEEESELEHGRRLQQVRPWSPFNREGYAVATNAPGLQCPAGQVDCHYRGLCVDLQTNPLYCGDCSNVCDFNVQTCIAGVCTCKPEAPPCPERGNKCLHVSSCDALKAGHV